MSLRILLVAATKDEAAVLLKIKGLSPSGDGFSFGDIQFDLLVPGVGSIATSWALIKWFSANPKPDLALNFGIAGSYRDYIKTGDVVVPVSDCFADAGIETGTGFMTLSEAGLEDPDSYPFKAGRIVAENRYIDLSLRYLKPVNAITVNTATGSAFSIEKLFKKFNPDIETLEGATFFYICSEEKIPFLAIRSISNRVEPRNKDNWNIKLALDNLSEKIKEFILMVE